MMSPTHSRLLDEVVELVQSDPDVIGILLQGSLARGDGYPTSDLDIFLLFQDGCGRPFAAEERDGILVERHASDWEHATAKVRANPMLAYGFVDGRILRDDTGALAELVQTAQQIIASYKTPEHDLAGILYWLRSSRIKIRAASDAGDSQKAAFVVATTSWKILEGLWAVNDLPMPPSGTVLARRRDLTRVPEKWDGLFDALFQGDTPGRIQASLTIIDWLLDVRDDES